jgi:hypothetical protein
MATTYVGQQNRVWKTTIISPSTSPSTTSSSSSSSFPPGPARSPDPADPAAEKKTPVAAIVGGTVGGIAALAFMGLGACFLIRRRDGSMEEHQRTIRQKQQQQQQQQQPTAIPVGEQPTPSPPINFQTWQNVPASPATSDGYGHKAEPPASPIGTVSPPGSPPPMYPSRSPVFAQPAPVFAQQAWPGPVPPQNVNVYEADGSNGASLPHHRGVMHEMECPPR